MLVPIAHSRRLRFVELRGLPLREVHRAWGFGALGFPMKPVLTILYAEWEYEDWLLGAVRVQKAEDGKGNRK